MNAMSAGDIGQARYAIYWAPRDGSDLARLAESWLGRNARDGGRGMRPSLDWISAERLEALTREPARYGVHATLKAPFRLRSGTSREDLEDAMEALAMRLAPFQMPTLAPRLFADFIVLAPLERSPALDALAASCVRDIDEFRAPATPDEIARRRLARLSSSQEELMQAWGYPYVFEEFRFHVTLAGPADPGELSALLPGIADYFASPELQATEVRDISLFVEQEPGAPFRLLRRFALKG